MHVDFAEVFVRRYPLIVHTGVMHLLFDQVICIGNDETLETRSECDNKTLCLSKNYNLLFVFVI